MDLKKKLISLSRQNIERCLNIKEEELFGFEKRKIWELTNSKKNVVVIGLRRIGKTTLLDYLVRNRFESKFNVPNSNEEETNLNQIFKDENIKKPISIKKSDPTILSKENDEGLLYIKLDTTELLSFEFDEIKKIPVAIKELIRERKINLLLIDEIQVLDKWNYFIKDLVDTYDKEIQIYATGSNSNALITSSEHGIGRFEIRFFGVLPFEEAKIVKKNENLGAYIDFEHLPKYNELQYDDEVPQLIIEKALNNGKSNAETLFKVLKGIIKSIGFEISLTRLARNSGVNKTYIRDYIDDLTHSQLIFKIENVKKDQNVKIYSLVPSMYRLFTRKKFVDLYDSEKGHIFEQFVLIQILAQKTKLAQRIGIGFYRQKIGDQTYEIDFVINNKLIEVKYSKRINEIEKYIQIAKELKSKELYFVYRGKTNFQNNNGIKIQFINWKEISKYEF